MSAILTKIERYFGFQQPLVWKNVIGITVLHVAAIYTFLVIMPFEARFITSFLGWLYACAAGLGVSIGAHRLWTHKTFKATVPLRIFIMYWYLAAGQYSVVQWVRDHRTHHKFTDTDADPHNAKRGFFFSHCGWLMMKRHPEVKEKGKLIDVSDVWEDPVVSFSQKYYFPLLLLSHSIIPACFARYVLGETWFTCIVGVIMTRYLATLHVEWSVNSVAHLWGYKPYNKKTNTLLKWPSSATKKKSIITAYYPLLGVPLCFYTDLGNGDIFVPCGHLPDVTSRVLIADVESAPQRNIMAVQNKLGAFFTLGEAWHNFHHTFPWDYRIGEYGQGYQVGTYIIDLFSWLGLAYDLKTASPEIVKKVLAKQGELEVNEEVPYPETNDDKVKQEDLKEKIKDN